MSDLVLNALRRKLVNADEAQTRRLRKRIRAIEKKAAPVVEKEAEAPAEAESEGEA